MTRRAFQSILTAIAFCAIALTVPGVALGSDGDLQAVGDSQQQVLVLLRIAPRHFRPNSDYADGYGDGVDQGARRRAAKRLARKYGLAVATNWPLSLLGVDCFVMNAPPDRSPDAVAAQLSRDPAVEWAEPMAVFHAQRDTASYNDPLFVAQPVAQGWRLEELHEIATGRNVHVAVIDSRIDEDHPDLAGQIYRSRNFVLDKSDAPEDHGTGVAGVIAALADNGEGIVGVAPQARLMALRACWEQAAAPAGSPTTICDTLSLAKALDYAITYDAEIINLSLSGPPTRLLAELLDAALERGVTVVGAYDGDLPDGGFPASHAGVVAVSDGSQPAQKAGVYIAPGQNIPTTQPGARWYLVNGSSFAAADVSGLFALLREHDSLARTPSVLVTMEPGHGAVDAYATLLHAIGNCDRACSQFSEYAADAGK